MRSRAGSAQHTCDEKVAVRPACPPVSAFPRRRTPPFRPPRRSAPGEGRRTRARSAASSGARFPPLSAPPLQRLTGWPRDPALSWFSGRPDLRGGFDGLCCREEHCAAGAVGRPEAVRLPSRLLRRLRPEIRNADAQASGPGQALLSRFLSHVASSLCVLAPSSLAGGPRTGQAPALAGCTPRRPAPRGRGPPPSRAARLPTRDGRSARW